MVGHSEVTGALVSPEGYMQVRRVREKKKSMRTRSGRALDLLGRRKTAAVVKLKYISFQGNHPDGHRG